MSEKMIDESCRNFTAVLASKAPVPGGGGVAALVGAFGAALGSMVGNLTLGRKKYAAVEADIKIILEKAESLQRHLLELVDEDAKAFEPLSKAYSLPKDEPERAKTLERVTLEACRAPLEMMKSCCQVIDLLEELLDKGSALLVSDVGCGALCCRSALEIASLNIFINTKTLTDEQIATQLENQADDMLKRYGPKAQKIADAVVFRLRKER